MTRQREKEGGGGDTGGKKENREESDVREGESGDETGQQRVAGARRTATSRPSH